MTDSLTSADWWSARRLHYNVGLLVAGALAFLAYVVVGFTILSAYAEFAITLFTLFQGAGCLFMIGVANVCYSIGPLSERIIRPSDPERYRQICFRLGFWFSMILPFSIPVILAVLSIFYPNHWRHQE
jgi:hypothetical protein